MGRQLGSSVQSYIIGLRHVGAYGELTHTVNRVIAQPDRSMYADDGFIVVAA